MSEATHAFLHEVLDVVDHERCRVCVRRAIHRGYDWVRRNTFPSGRGPQFSDNAEMVKQIGREAADVANFALMLADVCGALAGTTETPR